MLQQRRLEDQRCTLPKRSSIKKQEMKSLHTHLASILEGGPPYPQVYLETGSGWRIHQPSRHQLLFDNYECPIEDNDNASAYR